jgi:prepilin-type processing-associated H-X9-DG protein
VAQLTVPAKARLKGRAATLSLQCAGTADCAGTVRIQSRAAGKRRPVTYASSAFAIGAGAKQSVKAKLSSAGRKALRRHRSLRAYANVTFADGRVTSTKITLRR